MRNVSVRIRSAGVATSQGSESLLRSGKKRRTPVMWNLDKSESIKQQVYSVFTPGEVKNDGERFLSLAKSALFDCLRGQKRKNDKIPLIVASCNGSAGEFEKHIWSKSFFGAEELSKLNPDFQIDFVVSGSCASGLQALTLGFQMLQAGIPEVIVLSTDILTGANLINFRNLRILNENEYLPWDASSEGFIPSEAGVALHLCANSENGNSDIFIHDCSLSSDFSAKRSYEKFLENKNLKVDFVIGQGAGAFEIDNEELSAVKKFFTTETPLTTPYYAFGHSAGSSGLLSVALAYFCLKEQRILPDLKMPRSRTMDGQKLLHENIDFLHKKAAILCRALSGAGAFLTVQKGMEAAKSGFEEKKKVRKNVSNRDRIKKENTVILNSLLQKVFNQAVAKKPKENPDILIVLLNSPIEPEESALYKNQLLPAGILEITPSYLPQLICRAWQFTGPSLALLTRSPMEKVMELLLMYTMYLSYCFVWIQGNGQNRNVKWIFKKK